MKTHSSHGQPTTGLLNPAFLTALAVSFAGFSLEHLLRPVVPLIVLDRGGGVVLMGAVAAVYALPSLLFRPVVGRLIDTWSHTGLMRIGAILATLMPAGLLLPGAAALVPVRFLQGTAWAMYSVGSHTLIAKLSPKSRRGEASGYFMATPAVAAVLSPSVGIALYLSAGELGLVLVASGLGLLALALVVRVNLPSPASPAAPGSSRPPSLDRRALPAGLMIAAFLGAQPLFTVFPPIYVESVGAPLESLVWYYPAYGSVLLLSQLAAGRLSDRLGRGLVIRVGCAVAVLGLLVAAVGGSMFLFVVGAALYALSASLVSPTVSALAIDRAQTGRIGSAMATYSMGFQLASGAGSLAWGTILSATTFGWALAMAAALPAATLVLSVRYAGTAGPSLSRYG